MVKIYDRAVAKLDRRLGLKRDNTESPKPGLFGLMMIEGVSNRSFFCVEGSNLSGECDAFATAGFALFSLSSLVDELYGSS